MSTEGEMARRHRRTTPPPGSLPVGDDMLGEILLRLPPRPSSLPRASLVCKRWRRLVADPRFQRRFRDHHGKPPLIGFFADDYKLSCSFVPMLDGPDRIPCDRFSMMSLDKAYNVIDCRHGLVLLFSSRQRPPIRILVWDPVSREQHRLILPPELDKDQIFIFNGAVLRPAGGHRRHFQVALAAHYLGGPNTRVFACLYSSEIGAWSGIIPFQLESFVATPEPSTLIGNSICWLLKQGHHEHSRYVILQFKLDRQSLGFTKLPPDVKVGFDKLWIIPTEDGGLGFIDLSGFHARLWKRKPDPKSLSVWVLDRAIEFKDLSSTWKGYPLFLVGFAEESNAILLKIASCFFMLYLKSMEYKKLSNMSTLYRYYPFEYCYGAGTGIVDGHGGDEVNNM